MLRGIASARKTEEEIHRKELATIRITQIATT
jgi:hypothetical protein